MGMVIADGYPYAEGLPDTPSFADTPPYHQWHMKVKSGVSSGYPCMLQVPALFRTADIQPPYPDYVMRCLGEDFNNGYPLIMQINKVLMGAFANAYELKKVSIPKSCKKIGRYAFRNTKLTSVTIASDCTYYDTSFPDGCVVNFYPD